MIHMDYGNKTIIDTMYYFNWVYKYIKSSGHCG